VTRFLKAHLGKILIAVGIIVGYYLLTDVFGVLNTFLFYSLKDIPPLFVEYSDKLLEGFKSSMFLFIPSYAMAVLLGIIVGVYLGLHAGVRKNVTPYIYGFSAIPVTLLTPYAINILPSFKVASMFIIFLGCFWLILSTTQSAVMTIDKRYLETAATLEMPKMENLFRVILPAASPGILTGCTIALKFAFMLLAVAEMFGADSGMGFFIQYYSDFGRFDLVAVGFFFMAAILVIIMYAFDVLKGRLLKWTMNN
jgi:NitT/TauT family transport system permease protein